MLASYENDLRSITALAPGVMTNDPDQINYLKKNTERDSFGERAINSRALHQWPWSKRRSVRGMTPWKMQAEYTARRVPRLVPFLG